MVRNVTKFQSTLPARGATASSLETSECSLFQSTLPARGATPPANQQTVRGAISIHAPRTGSDHRVGSLQADELVISIHAPRTGSDAGRAGQAHPGEPISIHAPRTGSDSHRVLHAAHRLVFQSTLPARGATSSGRPRWRTSRYFNPRSPHGERQMGLVPEQEDTIFQSTLPARGATSARNQRTPTGAISIHAPRTGSDSFPSVLLHPRLISIHAPRTGSDALPP